MIEIYKKPKKFFLKIKKEKNFVKNNGCLLTNFIARNFYMNYL